MALTKLSGDQIQTGAITAELLAPGVGGGPTIANVQIANSSYVALDDTAVALEGGYIIINGENFEPNVQVLIGNTVATSVTYVSASQVRAQIPALITGSKVVYLVNTDTGSTAIRVNGVTYSSDPTWVTDTSLTGQDVDVPISIQLSATSDSNVSYSLASGSSLPPGVSLAANGLLSGTVTGIEDETTYNFTVVATDEENQDSSKSFSVTISAGDEYFNYNVLLLSGDGTNGAQNNTFLDGSTNNFTITRNGNTTQGTFTPFSKPDGRWGNFATAASASVGLRCATAALVGSTTTTFTVECWIYMTDSPVSTDGVPALIGLDATFNSSLFLGFGPNASRRLVLRWFDGASKTATGGTTLNLNTWYHIAAVASSNALAIYVDGVAETLSGTTTLTNRNNTTNAFSLFFNSSASNYQFRGYASNIRVCTSAVYTTGFTPSTLPLTTTSQGATNCQLLTAQSNRFVDNSSNAYVLTRSGDVRVTPFSPFTPLAAYDPAVNGGSGYFDGNGDSVSMTGGADNRIGTSDYTVELFFYSLNAGILATLVSYGSSGNTFRMFQNNNGNLLVTIGSSSLSGGAGGVAAGFTAEQWFHVVVVRSGGDTNNCAYFVNGTRISNFTNTSNFDAGSPQIGMEGASLNPFIGYISNFRLVKSAIYNPSNTTITVPTLPYSVVSGTAYQLNFTNAAIIDSTGQNVLETVGNTQIDTTTKKYGTGSMKFNGTEDRLQIQNSNPVFAFQNESFTLEAWIYMTGNNSASRGIVSNRNSGSGAHGFSLSVDASNKLKFEIGNNSSSNAAVGSTSLSLNTWYHVAAVLSGTTMTVYVNGTSEGTTTRSVGAITLSQLVVGRYWYNFNDHYFIGFIDDLRITKGIARYTSNFTPPASAHKLK